MKFLYRFLFFILIVNYSSFLIASECLRKKDDNGMYWTRKQGRSQIGKFIQFSAKSVHSNKFKSWLVAKGTALEMLIEECGVIPQETKAFESCQEFDDRFYNSYIRYSVEKKDCNSSSKTNDKLNTVLVDFKKYKSKTNDEDNYSCLKEKQGCIVKAELLRLRSDFKGAKMLLISSCNLNIAQACLLLYEYYAKDSNEPAKKNLKKACLLKSSNACHTLYRVYGNEKDVETEFNQIFCRFNLLDKCDSNQKNGDVEILKDSISPLNI